MVQVTPQMVKELRDRTLVGMADCKSALVEADGDVELAIEFLRKKGIVKAAKRADNATHEGKILIDVAPGVAYVGVVSSETDFVSRNDVFGGMVSQFVDFLKTSATDEEALAKAEDLKTDFVLKIGENMRILALTKITGEVVAAYVHSNNKLGAVVVAKAGTDVEKVKQIAMHVVASNPLVLSPNDVDADAVAKEKEIALAQMQEDPKNAGKPVEILEKIIEGKMAKFKEENALLTQPFVMDPSVNVGNFIGNENIVSFSRFAI